MVKWGLGESYDKVNVLPVKARAYLDLTKPASSIGVGGAYALGSLFYFYFTNQADLIIAQSRDIIFVIVTMVFAHAASQAMNMAEDAEMDTQTPHKQNRPIPSGIVSEEEARMLAWFFMLFAIGRAYLVNSTFGGFTTLLIIFGIFYNLEPIRAKERIISIPWQAASRGLLLFPAIWAAYGDPWQLTPWILGLVMFFYVLGFQNSADIIDSEVDEKFGIKTFVVVFGLDNTILIAELCTIAVIIIIFGATELGLIESHLIWMEAIIPFCLIMIYHMDQYPQKVSDRTGNHPAWLWYYVGMVLLVLIPLLAEIVYG